MNTLFSKDELYTAYNALIYCDGAISLEQSGLKVSEDESNNAKRYYKGFPNSGTHPVDPDMMAIYEAALRRVLVILDGDPELLVLVDEEPKVRALAERFRKCRTI